MDPTTFEAATVALFRQMDIQHEVFRTRRTGDGGFDFYGRFTFPPPLDYEVAFLGEAKRYARSTPVTPKDVSRLVARLGRGQYGIFATTSYFTTQAQEEVLSDAYPATLIAGSDLVRMMRELRVASGAAISPAWLDAVRSELESATSYPDVGGPGHVWIHDRSSGAAGED
jgi:restriction endonuclease Mrr